MTQRKMIKTEDEDESLKGPTMVLVGVNVGFYIITTIVGGSVFFTGSLSIILFGFSLPLFFSGLFWTPITSMIAHSGIPHLLGNMIFLLVYGFKLEEEGYNEKGIYVAYLITGLCATLFSAPILGDTISLGASGAVFGLLGVTAGIERRNKGPNFRKMVFASIILFIFATSPNTNVFAHLFGLISGIILGNSPWFEQFHSNEQTKFK